MEQNKKFFTFLVEKITNHPVWESIQDGACMCAPVAVAISAFFISNFFFRFADFYRRKYITARQTLTGRSMMVAICPIIFLSIGCFLSKENEIYGFALISSILSIFYPLLSGKKIIAVASPFPFSLLFSALIIDHPAAIYLFSIAILAALYKFDGENDTIIFINRNILTPFIIAVFAFLLPQDLSKLENPKYVTIGGFVGSFAGLFF